MSNAEPRPSPRAEPTDAAAAARRLVRTARKGSLATLDRDTGHPYASLVLVATEPDGAPTLLISALALHTKNLAKDQRASLLIDGTGGLDEPLTGGRVTLVGTVRRSDSASARARFLARHPSAAGYAGFPDFAFNALACERAHYVGGFGRIVDLAPASLLSETADAHALIEAEAGILAHMNADHADAVALYATVLGKGLAGAWRMCGIDPDGADLLHCTSPDAAVRIDFPERVLTPGDARNMLVALVKQARAQSGSNV
jgi:putative heme iron utilization protein